MYRFAQKIMFQTPTHIRVGVGDQVSSTKKTAYELHQMYRSVQKNHVPNPHLHGIMSSIKKFLLKLYEMLRFASKIMFRAITSMLGWGHSSLSTEIILWL